MTEVLSEAIQEITGIAQQLKEAYKDLNGRFKEHEEKQREFNRLARAEEEALLLIKGNRTAIRTAYKALTGADIDESGA